jgi:hypothetical protein
MEETYGPQNKEDSNNQDKEKPSKKFDEIKECMLKDLLLTPVNVWDKTNNTTKSVLIGDIIDKDDIWFTTDRPKPLINEKGFDKLVRAANVVFEDPKFIEKQSDFNNVKLGQVVIQIRAVFPNGETNTEMSTANALNCTGDISIANMPIMAEKRAKARAFYRSDFIDLNIFDETEKTEELSKMFRDLEEDNDSLKKSYKDLRTNYDNALKDIREFYKLVVDNTPYKDRIGNVMTATQAIDPEKLEIFLNNIKNETDPLYQLNPLQEKVFSKRLSVIKKEKEDDDNAKLKTAEMLYAKAESRKDDNFNNFYH